MNDGVHCTVHAVDDHQLAYRQGRRLRAYDPLCIMPSKLYECKGSKSLISAWRYHHDRVAGNVYVRHTSCISCMYACVDCDRIRKSALLLGTWGWRVGDLK